MTAALTAARAHLAHAGSVGGLLPLSERGLEQWRWSGAWRFPVGDARDFQTSAKDEAAYRLLRGLGSPGEDGAHQGADLGCGHGGDPVRAAATGLVVVAEKTVGTTGYGRHVVLAHRLPGGDVAYSVYAHLAAGSIPIHVGQTVEAGRRIGRVGMSGHATSPHLHFEVRRTDAADVRWEKVDPVDPLDFVSGRLAAGCDEDSLRVYCEWAQYAGLLGGAGAADDLRPGGWWRMLAVATCRMPGPLPAEAAVLADSLIAAGVLPDGPPPAPDARLEWRDMARDLARVRTLGVRLPQRPISKAAHRRACQRWLGEPDPIAAIRDSPAAPQHPTVASALLALAELAPPQESERAKTRARAKTGASAHAVAAGKAHTGSRPTHTGKPHARPARGQVADSTRAAAPARP